MSATPEHLSWRESVAAQLYEIADSWSRGDMDTRRLARRLYVLAERSLNRQTAESFGIEAGNVAFPAIAREKEWR